MPLRTTPKTATPYTIVAFDADSNERRDDSDAPDGRMSAKLIATAAEQRPTDLFLFSHGWRGDMPSAIDQYDRWIDAVALLEEDRKAMGATFKPLWCGIHWPSEPWGDEEIQAAAFDVVAGAGSDAALLDMRAIYLERLGLGDNAEAAKQLEIIMQSNIDDPAATTLPPEASAAYERLSQMLDTEPSDPSTPDDHVDFDAQAAFEAFDEEDGAFGVGSFLGGILAPLRVLSFWTMKKRALKVGATGVHEMVAALQNAVPGLRVHIMGHSFGCIVASSLCAGADGTKPLPRPVQSLVLVQGAFSFWSYAEKIPSTKKPGFFAAMMQRGAVKGPVVTTQSTFDLAVGKWYPRATSLVRESVDFAAEAAGATPDFSKIVWGAVGTYGLQGFSKVDSAQMLPADGTYRFTPGHVTNVESSAFIKKMVGASGAHSDIDGPEVAHLIWQAAREGNLLV